VELVPVPLLGEVGHPLPQVLQRDRRRRFADALARRRHRLLPAAVHLCLTDLSIWLGREKRKMRSPGQKGLGFYSGGDWRRRTQNRRRGKRADFSPFGLGLDQGPWALCWLRRMAHQLIEESAHFTQSMS
jgi:hypothetical protein